MKGPRVTKIIKEIKFEGVWGNSESKKGFQRQSLTKYLRLAVVSIFHEILASINKILILVRRLDTLPAV